MTYNVIRINAHQVDMRPEAEVLIEGYDGYAEALRDVADDIEDDTILVPLNAPDVASLAPYNVKQAWSLRDYATGEKIALLGIQEVS